MEGFGFLILDSMIFDSLAQPPSQEMMICDHYVCLKSKIARNRIVPSEEAAF